jgi:3-oxoacyl-[acyl-carrier protein] reductase
MDSDLKGRVVMVTGASGGIGASCAREFAAEGAVLVLHANRNFAAAERLMEELPGEACVVRADLSREPDVERAFAGAIERFGRIDALVLNAGIWEAESTPIHRMSLDRWERTVAVNQTSVFLCAREYFRWLDRARPETASVVLIGSTAAVFGEAGHVEYSASKAAITYGMTRTLKNEIVGLVPLGRVNAVCPSWTITPMAESSLADRDALVRTLQTRAQTRIARAEDIARAVVFLSSHRLAGHVTGEVMSVTGGMEGRLLHEASEVDPARA